MTFEVEIELERNATITLIELSKDMDKEIALIARNLLDDLQTDHQSLASVIENYLKSDLKLNFLSIMSKYERGSLLLESNVE